MRLVQKLEFYGDSINKCCIMQLSKCQHKSEFLCVMLGQVLKIIEQHPYLGVIIDHQLSLPFILSEILAP